jgi:acyl carrier protein
MSVSNDNPQNEEIYLRIKKVINEVLKISPDKVNLESKYIDDLGADSLDRVTLVMQLEDEFGKEIPEEDAKQLTSVGATVDYIVNHL